MFRILQVFVCLLLLTASGLRAYCQVAVPGHVLGYTKGQANVNDIGAAVYSVPLKVAPGINGIQPQLSISYSSTSGNGPLGIGFAIGGLSVISRTSRTVAQDVPYPTFPQYLDNSINFNLFDRYSLDGEAIRLAADNIDNSALPFANYGYPGTRYFTEQNTFQKIVLQDTLNGSPTYFQVYTKDGLTKEYGNTADSRIVLSSNNLPIHWFLNKVTDRNGNFMHYYYYNDIATGQYYPLKIEYCGNANMNKVPTDSVIFIYEDRPDQTSGFFKGAAVQTTKLLKQIVSYAYNKVVRSYNFTYSYDGSFSTLSQVQECSDSACLDPVSLQWSQFIPQYDSLRISNPINPALLNNTQYGDTYYSGDFDGDGLQDLFVFQPSTGNNYVFLNRLSNGSGNFQEIDNLITPAAIKQCSVITADFNSDGRTDLYFVNPNNGEALFYLTDYANNTVSFTPQTTLGLFPNNTFTGSDYTVQTQDMNNDGLPDFTVSYTGQYQNVANIRMYINSGNYNTNKSVSDPSIGINSTDLNFTTAYFYSNYNLPTDLQDTSEIYTVDFDHNLFPDYFLYNRKTGTTAIIYNYTLAGNSYAQTNTYAANDATPIIDPINPADMVANDSTKLYFDDLNGDGLPDLIYYDPINNVSKWWLNNGNFQFVPYTPSFDLAGTISSTGLKGISIGDFNGDGISDICLYDAGSGNYKIYTNDGQLNFNPYNWGNPVPQKAFNSNYVTFSGAYQGNTYGGYLIIDPTTGHNEVWINNWGAGHYRKLVSISEGSNKSYNFDYTTLNGLNFGQTGSVYTKTVNYTTYPTTQISSNFEVVSNFFSANPVLGTYLQGATYQYQGARASLDGRGFRGFSVMTETNTSSGVSTVKTYYQDTSSNIYVGDPLTKLSVYLPQPSGILVSESDYTLAYKFYPRNFFGMSFYSYTQQNTSYNYEVDGSLDNITRTAQQVDDYGNPIVSVTDYGGGYEDSTVSQYYNDTANWILGRLTNVTLYRMAPGQPTLIRSSSFQYDPVTGQIVKETAFPDLAQNQQVSKTYTYDGYGNILESDVTAWNGNNYETRTVQTVFDTSGRYVVQRINALGQTTSSQYNLYTGDVISSTDENGLVTNYTYDDFGRLKKTIFPDGNWTQTDYVNYNVNLSSATAIYNDPTVCSYAVYKQSSVRPPELEFYDFLDRLIGTEKTGFSGKQVITDRTINDVGYVTQESRAHYSDESPVYTTYDYDALGRQVGALLPGNRQESIQTAPGIKGLTNSDNQNKTILTNARGQVVKVIDNNNKSITYAYDAANNLLSTTDPKGNTILFTYDLRGYKTAMTDPDLGAYTFTYNGFGELVRQSDAKGNVITLQYDKLGRVTKKTEKEGASIWAYDGTNGIGKISSTTSASGSTVSYSYDKYGRTTQATTTVSGRSYTSQYIYDQLSRLQQLIYPSGFTLQYNYNAYGFLYEIRRPTDNFLFWGVTARNASGMLQSQQQQNNVLMQIFYNPATLFVDSLKASNASRFINEWQFQFDNIGNLLSRTNELIGKTEQFQYDNLNRLTKSEIAGDTTNNVTVSYDDLGNIVQKSDVGTYEYGAAGSSGPHQVVKVNLITTRCIPSWQVNYEYTSFNKVSKIYTDTSSLEIGYDFNQQRQTLSYFIRGVLSKTKVYIGDNYEVDSSKGQVSEVHYIQSSDGTVATYTITNGQGSTHYWFKDHLGSVTVITDSLGNPLQQLSYDAWGKRRNADWTAIPDSVLFAGLSDRGFTGQEHYDLFDLIDMNGRIYDPVLGRFLSADPFIQDMTDLQSFNRYSYVLNNPLALTDPTGYWSLGGFLSSIGNAISSAINSIGNAIGAAVSWVGSAISSAAQWVKANYKTLIVVAVAIGVGVLTGGAGTAALLGGGFWGGLGAAVLSGAAAGFASNFVAGELNGDNIGDALKSALQGAAVGALTAGVAYGSGALASALPDLSSFSIAQYGIKVAGTAILQGGFSNLNGGRILQGLYSAIISDATDAVTNNIDDQVLSTMAAAAISGTSSALNGGSFVNGAATAAYGMMFSPDAYGHDYDEAEAEGKSVWDFVQDKASQVQALYDDVHDVKGFILNTVTSELDQYSATASSLTNAAAFIISSGQYGYQMVQNNFYSAKQSAGDFIKQLLPTTGVISLLSSQLTAVQTAASAISASFTVGNFVNLATDNLKNPDFSNFSWH